MRWLLLAIAVLVTACGDQAGDGYTIDLEKCTLDGRPMLGLLQIDPAASLSAKESGRYQTIVTEAADHGVYFGLCGIDVEHGQAMALRIPDLELGRPGFQGKIRPLLGTLDEYQARYGQPISQPDGSIFTQVSRTGDRIGRFADWSSICQGLTMRLDFDHRDRLSAITIYPTPGSE
jgi:hypothetical protein